jgi:hypothetical protein
VPSDGPPSTDLTLIVTAFAGLTLLTIRGLSRVGVLGIAERLFRALFRSHYGNATEFKIEKRKKMSDFIGDLVKTTGDGNIG